jgi:hypothetical protein
MAFKYRVSGADFAVASADVFGARTAIAAGGTGLTLNPVASYDHRVITIDVQSDEMPDGKPWLTVETDDGSASVLLMSAIGVGWPREAATPTTPRSNAMLLRTVGGRYAGQVRDYDLPAALAALKVGTAVRGSDPARSARRHPDRHAGCPGGGVTREPPADRRMSRRHRPEPPRPQRPGRPWE